jgi:hypothetical protein
MLGWDLAELAIDQEGGLASPFRFVITFSGAENAPELKFQGDGVVLRSGSVHFHREEMLRQTVVSLGLNAENFLDYLADMVASRRGLQPPARA